MLACKWLRAGSIAGPRIEPMTSGHRLARRARRAIGRRLAILAVQPGRDREFEGTSRLTVDRLSRGQRPALGITIGLAARAEVTLFDEPYVGLDAVARQIFYDRLLAEYADFPRTVLLSTHLIDEAAGLFENVVVIDRGRVTLDTAAGGLRGRYLRKTASGPGRWAWT